MESIGLGKEFQKCLKVKGENVRVTELERRHQRES
jgi:hypothetical protein